MVKEIQIENFKSIKKQTISLRNLNVLIGQNGAGKSNFISFFKFLERLVNQELSGYIFENGGINNFLYNGYNYSNYINVNIELSPYIGSSNTYNFKISSNGEDYIFSGEKYGFWEKDKYPSPLEYLIFGNGKEASIKKHALQQKVAKYVYNYLKDFKVYHFHDTSNNATLKTPQDIDDVYFFKNEGENIAPFLLYIKNKDINTYLRITEAISLVYPKFNDFELQESPTAKGKVVLRWVEKGNENVFNVKQVSDGTLRFICLATLLLQPRDSKNVPETILLDEPELGLHPFAIHVLAELIKKASFDRQIILATQSVTLINHFEPEDLLIAERTDDGQTIFNKKTSEELQDWIQDFTLGEIWESNLLGGRP